MENKLLEIHSSYHEKVSEIYLYQRDINAAIDSELKEVESIGNSMEGDLSSEREALGYHNMTFRSASSGDLYFFSQEVVSLEKKKQNLKLRKNRQYQWLLAELFEEFEGVIKSFYAAAGFLDNSFWKMSDYGDLKISEIKDKEYQWFEERVKGSAGGLSGAYVLKRFRDEVDGLEYVEKDNHYRIDLKFIIEMVRQFRHSIVHSGGVVYDKQVFYKKILDRFGRSGSSASREKYIGFLDEYFLMRGFPSIICMLEVQGYKGRLPVRYDVFEYTNSMLMSYVEALYKELCRTFYN